MKKRILIYGSLGGLCLLLFIGYMLLQSPDTDVAAQTPPIVEGSGAKAKQGGTKAGAKQEKTPAKEDSKEQRPIDEAGFDQAVYGKSQETYDKVQNRFEEGVKKSRTS